MGRWNTLSDEDLRAKSQCPHLCVREHDKMSSLPSYAYYPHFFNPPAMCQIT